MPFPNARSFLQSKKEPSRDERLAALKEELLMLAALKNHDEEQTNLVELCNTTSTDDNESVDNFITEAQSVRSMEGNVLVASTSEAFEDGVKVVNVDPALEEKDEMFYEEDAMISGEPDVNEMMIMLGRNPRGTADYIFHHKIWEDAALILKESLSADSSNEDAAAIVKESPTAKSNNPLIVKVPHENRQDVPTSYAKPGNTAATTTPKLASLATKLVSSQAKLTTAQAKVKAGAAKKKAANAERLLEYRAEKIKRKEAATNERNRKKLSEAAMNAVLKEEAQKKKAEQAAAEAAWNETEDKRKAVERAAANRIRNEESRQKEVKMAAGLAAARVLLEEKRLILEEKANQREAEKAAARLLLEEKRLFLEEMAKQKEAEKAAARQLLKQKEVEKAKAAALAELQAAIKRVERAHEAATKVGTDPTYEIRDDVRVCNSSVWSRRSGVSMRGLSKSFSLKKAWSKSNNITLNLKTGRKSTNMIPGKLFYDSIEEDDMGLNLNLVDARDDITDLSRSRNLVSKLSGLSISNVSAIHAGAAVGARAANLAKRAFSFKEDSLEGDSSEEHSFMSFIPFVGSRDSESELEERSDLEIREQAIVEEGPGVQGWLEWFTSDPECGYCSGGSCTSSYNDLSEYKAKEIVPRFSRKEPFLAQ